MENEPQKATEVLQNEKHYDNQDQSLTETIKPKDWPDLENKHDLLEQLAELEHEQWVEWTRGVAQDLWPERRKRWQEYWVPYNQLPELAKDFARKWAQKVLDILETYKPRPAKTHGIEVIQPARNHHLDSEKVSQEK